MTASIAPWKVSQQDFPSSLPIPKQLRYLLRYAILAPSSRNTQPWLRAGERVVLYPTDKVRDGARAEEQ